MCICNCNFFVIACCLLNYRFTSIRCWLYFSQVRSGWTNPNLAPPNLEQPFDLNFHFEEQKSKTLKWVWYFFGNPLLVSDSEWILYFFSIFGEKLIFNGSQSKLDWDYFGSEIFKEFFWLKMDQKSLGSFGWRQF